MEQTITYKKAPLVELIVEVQWSVPTVLPTGGPPIVGGQSATFDRWFQRLTERLREQGFHDLERLIPHDMFSLAHQPVYRFRRGGDRFPVVQFGHGIFTLNAGPPNYHSWATFRPQVERTLAALIATKPEDDAPDTFSHVALRYIDLFDSELRAGASNYAFIRDTLGIGIGLPQDLVAVAPHPDQINPTLAVHLPIADHDNASLAFQVAASRLGQRPTTDTVMDMTYAVREDIPLVTADLMAHLENAYTVIHGWFEKLTARIRERMEPAS